MKRLTVVRHAQAGQAVADFDRPLTNLGCSQAFTTSTKLKGLIQPQYIMVSPARRTTQTLEEFLKVFGLSKEICFFEKSIYEASMDDLQELIKKIPDEVDEAVLIGHNPAVSSLVSSWTQVYFAFSVAVAVLMELKTSHWSTAFSCEAVVIAKISP